jgi:hypothetical protein
MAEPRTGYYTEQNRNEAYLNMLIEEEKLNNQCKLIVTRLFYYGPSTMQELDEFLDFGVHIVSARLNYLRKEGIVYNPLEWITDKKTGTKKQVAQKRLNTKTKVHNTLWALVNKEEKQLGIFKS